MPYVSASVKMTSEVGSHPRASVESKSPQSYAFACPTPHCWIMYSFASGEKKSEILHRILMSCGRSHNWDRSHVKGTGSCFFPSVQIKFMSLDLNLQKSRTPSTHKVWRPSNSDTYFTKKKGNANKLDAPRSVSFPESGHSGRRFLFGSITTLVHQ